MGNREIGQAVDTSVPTTTLIFDVINPMRVGDSTTKKRTQIPECLHDDDLETAFRVSFSSANGGRHARYTSVWWCVPKEAKACAARDLSITRTRFGDGRRRD